MHPQLTLAIARANQEEFLRRAARPASIRRPPRPNPLQLVRPAFSAVARRMHSGHQPVAKVAGAEA